MLLLDTQNGLLDLERRLVGVPIRAAGLVFEALDASIFIPTEDFIARLAADTKLTASHGHLLAFEEACNETKSLIHMVTLIPRHLEIPPNAEMCNLCARNKMEPMCPKAHFIPLRNHSNHWFYVLLCSPIPPL